MEVVVVAYSEAHLRSTMAYSRNRGFSLVATQCSCYHILGHSSHVCFMGQPPHGERPRSLGSDPTMLLFAASDHAGVLLR